MGHNDQFKMYQYNIHFRIMLITITVLTLHFDIHYII